MIRFRRSFLFGACVTWICALAPAQPWSNFVDPDQIYERAIYDTVLNSINSDRKAGDLGEPLSEDDLLRGPHTYEFRVLDDEGGLPIDAFVVQTRVMKRVRDDIPGTDGWSTDQPSGQGYRIGRLDTLRVSSTEGYCSISDLAAGGYDLQIWAEGYLPAHHWLLIGDEEVGRGEVRLVRGRNLAGRVIEVRSGKPVANAVLALSTPLKNGRLHYAEAYHKLHSNQISPIWPQFSIPGYVEMTDAEGRFEFHNLPADIYSPQLPELPDSIFDLNSQIYYKANELGATWTDRGPAEGLKEQFYARRYMRMLPGQSIHINGSADVAKVRIVAEEISRLSVTVQQEDGITLGGYPFEVFYETDGAWVSVVKLKTDELGTRQVPLIGLQAGQRVQVCSPGQPRFRNGVSPVNGEPVGHCANAVTFSARTGERIEQTIVVRDSPDLPTFFFEVRDAESGAPVADFEAVVTSSRMAVGQLIESHYTRSRVGDVDSSPDVRFYNSIDGTGKMVIPLFTPGEPEPAGFSWIGMSHFRNDEKGPLGLYVLVQAPGYAGRLFIFQWDSAQSGEPIQLDLTPEARIRGRVVLAGSGEPMTRDSVLSALEAAGTDESRKALQRIINDTSDYLLLLSFISESRKTPLDEEYPSAFQPIATISTDENGRFEYGGLQPRDDWSYKLTPPGLTSAVRRGIELKAGMNDIGDIVVGLPQALSGVVTDEDRFPLPGAVANLLSVQNPGFTEARTDAAGEFTMEIKHLTDGERQIVHVAPPWGHTGDGASFVRDIWFEGIVNVDPLRGAQMTCVTPRGATATLSLAPTPERAIIAQHYAHPENSMYYDALLTPERLRAEGGGVAYFALWRAALIRLEPDANGFVYHARKSIGSGAPFVPGEPMVFEMPHVPPGRYGARIDAGYFMPLRSLRTEGEQGERLYDETILEPSVWSAIAYVEFEMGTEPVTQELFVNFADFQVALEDWPRAETEQPETYVFLDRIGPSTASLGPAMRSAFSRSGSVNGREPEEQFVPFVGFSGRFSRAVPGSERNHRRDYVYHVADFRALPAGRYRLSAYSDMMQLSDGAPYYETEIEIAPDGASQSITIPYQE